MFRRLPEDDQLGMTPIANEPCDRFESYSEPPRLPIKPSNDNSPLLRSSSIFCVKRSRISDNDGWSLQQSGQLRLTFFDGPGMEILSVEPQQIECVENNWRPHNCLLNVERSNRIFYVCELLSKILHTSRKARGVEPLSLSQSLARFVRV
jgi:hypothetical protein